jgi:uncharacterized protein YndB with AHSA1/START domain
VTAEPHTSSVHIDAGPDRVFDYFVTPELLLSWMGRRAVLDPRPGGEFSLDVYRINVRGRYVVVDRPKRLVISWGHEGSSLLPPGASSVEVTFTPDGVGTLVQVTHSDLPEEEAANHAVGWAHFLARLAGVGAGQDPGPDPWLTSPPSAQAGVRRRDGS